MEEKTNLQHIQVPNNLIMTKDVEPIDCLVYLALKSFDGQQGCFPSLKQIAEKSQLSIKGIKKSLARLKEKHWIDSKCEGRGHYTYYTFLKDNPFEPFSYEFLNTDELTPMTKSYLICSQQDMFKNSESEGAMSKSALDISQDINMPLRTVYRCEQELKDKGILQVVKAERSKDIAGLKQEVRVYDFSKYFQAIAYILRHQQDQLNKHEKDIEELKRVIELRSDNAHTRQFEKNVIQAITELSKQLNELKKISNKS